MAWTCTGASNRELVANLRRCGLITSQRVEEVRLANQAMSSVDRANYVPNTRDAYVDSPQLIGCNATISAPHMHAHAAELLLPFLKPGANVLDVGSGTGYLTSVFHKLVGSGRVTGIEHIEQLAKLGHNNAVRDGLGSAIENGSLQFVLGDGRNGWPDTAPYDAVHVGAAAPAVPPALVEQLARPGRMIIPVGNSVDQCVHSYQVYLAG